MPLRPPNEDLFENSRMTFGEHLEELRKVLVRALLGTAIGVVIGMFFADNVVLWLKTPLTRAIADFSVTQAEEKLKARSGGAVPLEFRTLLDQRVMAPRRVLVDPDQLNQALLNNQPPRTAETASPTTRFTVRNVSADNVHAASRKLIDAVMAHDPSASHPPDPSASYPGSIRAGGATNGEQEKRLAIWNALSVDDQASITAWAGESPITPKDVTEFVGQLNRLAVESNLFDDPAFDDRISGQLNDGLFTSTQIASLKEMKDLLAANDSQNAAALRSQLNQWLLWSALAPDLPRPDVAFVEIDIWESVEVNAQSLAATEAFMIWMKAGLILGLVIASPWIFYQMWLFVAAGLYPHEQKYVYLYLPVSLALFWSGAALAFFFVFDPVLKFLFQFNASMGIDPQPRIGEWMSFVLLLPLGFGIAFQLPIVMLFLNLLGIFSVANYVEKWRIAVLVIFIVSMVLTPAEPISMILMAIPLTGLYFLGIAMCRWLRPNRNPYRQVYEP